MTGARMVGVAVVAPFAITVISCGVWWALRRVQSWMTVESAPKDSDVRA